MSVQDWLIAWALTLRVDQRGFTLLEVLLSAFILFLVLTSLTEVYRGALLTSGKAERALEITAAVPFIRVLITESFRENQPSEDHYGAGTYGALKYDWTSSMIREGRASVVVEQDAGTQVRYFLWDVQLTISADRVARRYEFREVSW